MSLRNKDVDWEREYQLKTIWPIEPHNLTSKIPKYISTGSILDLGAGEGHDAVYLAKLGYRVTAVDISETALERITKLARQSNCELTTQLASIEEYQPRCTYDGMISYGALQFLGPKGDERIRALQAATSASGLHSFYVFANRGDFSDLAKHKFWFPSESELRSLYIDWEIVHFSKKRVELHIRGDKGERLYNVMFKLLAYRSSSLEHRIHRR